MTDSRTQVSVESTDRQRSLLSKGQRVCERVCCVCVCVRTQYDQEQGEHAGEEAHHKPPPVLTAEGHRIRRAGIVHRRDDVAR